MKTVSIARTSTGALVAATAIALIAGLAGAACTTSSAEATAGAQIERGKYLVTTGGCNDCHTPLKMGANGPEPDMALMLSGHPEQVTMPPAPAPQGLWMWSGGATGTAFSGPWGVSFAANLTSDQNTGLGIWTEDMFVRAIRDGKHMGTSRPILPPMPWTALRHLKDDDLKAVFAYLKTVPAIANHVPDPIAPLTTRLTEHGQ
jgi:mono/diheme cytochrome c family protein